MNRPTRTKGPTATILNDFPSTGPLVHFSVAPVQKISLGPEFPRICVRWPYLVSDLFEIELVSPSICHSNQWKLDSPQQFERMALHRGTNLFIGP